MQIRILIFLARKQGTTPEFFKNYMETKHVPLIRSITGSHFALSHTRNYLITPDSEPREMSLTGLITDIVFDAVTEIVFRDEDHFSAHLELINKPENTIAREKDEAEFLNRGATRFVRVSEMCRTESQ